MRKIIITIAAMLLLAACNFEEDLRNTSTQNDEVLIQASTQAECDALANGVGQDTTGVELAALVECYLNLGVKEDEVQTNCTPIDTWGPETYCIPYQDIYGPNWDLIIDPIIDDAIEETDNCPPCTNPHPTTGCKFIIFSVDFEAYECNHSTDDWEVTITATVYCCE